MRWIPGLLASSLVLAACVGQPISGPVAGTVASDAEQAQARSASFLRQQGFAVASLAPGSIEGSAGGGAVAPAWIDCELVAYRDLYGGEVTRMGFAEPRVNSAEVRVRLTPRDGQTEIAADADYAGSFTDRFSNMARQAPCKSSGELERAIIDAAAG
jgi:hypothetical protein